MAFQKANSFGLIYPNRAEKPKTPGAAGPHSPDTVFKRMQDGEFDLVVALYHDQGHIPLKLIAMDLGVNVTLGVPIVRTSVDHGTAFDIVGRGLADPASLVSAMQMARRLLAAA
mgnify:CR=1 FL=1